jgi:Uma2 family endonuclease
MATVATTMTTADLLAMPENGMDRWLVGGELREKSMTVRNRFHSRILICAGFELESWSRQQPLPRGQVLGGEAGVRLLRNPDTTFGIDIVYVSPEVMVLQSEETTLIDGVPVLAVEILSPNDTLEDTHEKIDALLNAGVQLVWIIDPYDRTVRVYRQLAEPVLFNATQQLTGEPHLPGFSVLVARLFE